MVAPGAVRGAARGRRLAGGSAGCGEEWPCWCSGVAARARGSPCGKPEPSGRDGRRARGLLTVWRPSMVGRRHRASPGRPALGGACRPRRAARRGRSGSAGVVGRACSGRSLHCGGAEIVATAVLDSAERLRRSRVAAGSPLRRTPHGAQHRPPDRRARTLLHDNPAPWSLCTGRAADQAPADEPRARRAQTVCGRQAARFLPNAGPGGVDCWARCEPLCCPVEGGRGL